jgi:hypothetical protein
MLSSISVFYIVIYKPIARQLFVKHLPVETDSR